MHIIMNDGVRVDFEDAVDNALVIKTLSGCKQVLKLVDARNNFSVDKKAIEFTKRNDAKNTIARAVVKSSTINALLLGFINNLNKPNMPTKVFSDMDEAYQWLLTFKKG